MPSDAAPTSRVRIVQGDARELPGVAAASIALVVTSPPYPMIPQWDEMFRRWGADGFDAMHARLSEVWAACRTALIPGGILAVNIGDALRTIDGEFRLWPNHVRVALDCEALGLRPLPYLLWKKPMNRPNAFLGSGFDPPNAYVTLDCEFILLFRKGPPRRFPPKDPRRIESRYTKPERDRWFSQVWTDIRGARQGPSGARTGAFPPEIPERLIRMFSVVGDTVLDPFAGTGTTLWAAERWGRNAVGIEIDPALAGQLEDRARGPSSTSTAVASGAPRPLRGPRSRGK
jgi:DNA modification methylase